MMGERISWYLSQTAENMTTVNSQRPWEASDLWHRNQTHEGNVQNLSVVKTVS